MYAQAEKPKENKSRAVANSVSQEKSNGKQGFGFVDNRREAITQRKLQENFGNNIIRKQQSLQKNNFISLDSSSVIQREKWVKEGNKYKIYNADDKTTRDPSDDEEMDKFPGSDVWRPGCVWDDSEEKWYEPNEEGGLKDREETGKLIVTPIDVNKYDEGVGKNFGHRFKFSVWMNAQSIKWKEKTDKPYDVAMTENEWIDLYAIYKNSSNVFKLSKDIKGYDREYVFDDPPGIIHEPNNKRKLEFKLEFKDKNDKEEEIEAEQNLATDEEGNITKHEFIQK